MDSRLSHLDVPRRGLWALKVARRMSRVGWRLLLRPWGLGAYCYCTILVHMIQINDIFITILGLCEKPPKAKKIAFDTAHTGFRRRFLTEEMTFYTAPDWGITKSLR